MVLAVDVHYKQGYAKAVGVLFSWEDSIPQKIITENIYQAEDYHPGQFYKRELPCIAALLKKVDLSIIKVILVDGHIYVDNNQNFGLGGHLWLFLEKRIPIVGIAKKPLFQNIKTVTKIFRGKSKKPLYVSSIGITESIVIDEINKMKGEYRIPTILKLLDKETKKE